MESTRVLMDEHRAVDPHGNTLPAGVTWFGGVEPGYSVTVRWRGREASLVVAYRHCPDRTGIHQALTLKSLLTTIRDTVPPACLPAFAAAVGALAEEARGGCCCDGQPVGRRGGQ